MLRVTQSYCGLSWGSPRHLVEGPAQPGLWEGYDAFSSRNGAAGPAPHACQPQKRPVHLLPAGRKEGPPRLCPLPGLRPSWAQTPWQCVRQARKNNGQKGNSALPPPPSSAHCLSLSLKISQDGQKLVHEDHPTASLGHQAFLIHQVG